MYFRKTKRHSLSSSTSRCPGDCEECQGIPLDSCLSLYLGCKLVLLPLFFLSSPSHLETQHETQQAVKHQGLNFV